MAQNLLEVLGQIRGGAALHDAGKDLEELVAKVLETGKSGTITLKITVEPDKSDDRIVTMQPDVSVKLPKKPRAKGIFFRRPDGSLTKEDPQQIEMQMERQRQGVATIGAGGARSDDANLSKVGTGA